MVFVIMSSNTFSDIMYYTTNTDFLAASLFFVAGILVLSLWLINLLVAVIASSFKLAREELLLEKKQGRWTKNVKEKFFPQSSRNHLDVLRRTKLGKLYWNLRWVWILVIFADLLVQCTLDADSPMSRIMFIYRWQIWTTTALAVEIMVRFILYCPFWRDFLRSKGNIIDSFLAVANIIIIIPPIHNNELLYYWLTIFQISRFYRIAISIRFVRVLWAKVLGNYRTIFNLTIFYFLTTFLCSLMAAQLLRGVIPYMDGDGVQNVSFYDLSNSFIGMYVISSTENWTTMLYAATESATSKVAGACYAAFLIIWFIFSNFIILNMFVAVITENLEISPEVKRRGQIKEFVDQYANKMNEFDGKISINRVRVIKRLINRGKRAISSQKKVREVDEIESGDAVFNMLLDGKVVGGFLDEKEDYALQQDVNDIDFRGVIDFFRRIFKRVTKDKGKDKDINPFAETSAIVPDADNPAEIAQQYLKSKNTKDDMKRRYLESNPSYDRSLYIFSPTSKIRNACQRLVGPSVGIRQNGVYPKPLIGLTFWSLMIIATVAMVVISCINTPIYFKNFTDINGLTANNWVAYTDAVFVAMFTFEAIIKIIADGLYFTPNGYAKSSWNIIDMIVLITMWITLISELYFEGYVSRYVRCFEAFRALRLMTINPSTQHTFHSVIIVGFGKIFGAALISFCLLFPFSVWGLNIFHGRLSSCTDGDVVAFSECVDEYLNEPFNWEIYTPRAITKPYYDYDTFGHAFLIQFEVLSLEGWTDVLDSIMSITGPNTNPISFASRYNGIFALFYNILGTVFVITLFISVIIKNYSANRGTAYLKDEQLTWYEIQKLLTVVRPSIRAPVRTPGSLSYKLQQAVLHKGSWFHKIETFLLFVLTIVLVVEYYPTDEGQSMAIKIILLMDTIAYLLFFITKFYSLGWRKFIRRRWNSYGVAVAVIALTFTIIGTSENASSTFYNFQKLGVVGMMILWIPKSSRLDQLFKTASASLKEIANLLVTWLILFLAFAIAFNQVFGLTRIGPNGSDNINFRTVPKALILLFRMSSGEGWNQILNDYLVSPPFCVDADIFSNSDCGSHPFAYFLFIAWNILSMYIFVNMFVSLIFENFSYVFHHGSSHISKNDIKMFKAAWEKFDPGATGYIRVTELHKFLRQCDGYFSMKIYDEKFTIPNILSSSRARNPENIYDVDIPALNSVLRTIPYDEYRKRRQVYELFCTEAFNGADPDRGISFNSLLIQFPLYKTMDYRRCLK